MKTKIAQDALTYAQVVAAQKPSIGLALHGDSVAIRAEAMMKTPSQRNVGALAQLHLILSSALNVAELTDAVKSLIISPLLHDDEASALAKLVDDADLTALAKYKGKLTYRYILKNIGMEAAVALAATLSDSYTVQGLLLSNARNGGWTSFGADYSFCYAEYKESLAAEIHDAISRIDGNADLATACGWFKEGPFASGSFTMRTKSTSTTTQGVPAMTSSTTTFSVNPAVKPLIDGMLQQAGVNLTIDSIISEIESKKKIVADAEAAEKMAADTITSLRQKLASQSSMPQSMTLTSASTTIPSGKVDMVQADTLFPMMKGINLMVPHFIWDHAHPDVPVVNDAYIFRKENLIKVLRCLSKRENIWLQGHTGSGKTTLVEQIAARLGWPVARVAFDSNVDRSEMVGRMQLDGDGKGGTVSKWLAGILEKAWANGYILLCDELDAGHPSALYTLQPILEGKPLTLLEDGGRVINQAPFSCIAATGNTTGNGDPSGLYPACRILSAATLDRFQTFVNVPYMTPDEERALLDSQVPGLPNALLGKMVKFGVEMRQAFTTGQTPISYSPRRSVAFAREVNDLFDMGYKDEKVALTAAFKSKLFDASSEEYRQRITELANATFGSIDPTQTLA